MMMCRVRMAWALGRVGIDCAEEAEGSGGLCGRGANERNDHCDQAMGWIRCQRLYESMKSRAISFVG